MGMPLTEYVLSKKFDAGIEIVGVIRGTVPEFECREAAVYVQVSWEHWMGSMDGWERACAVAHYRTSLLLKANLEDAAEKAARRKASRGRRRSARAAS